MTDSEYVFQQDIKERKSQVNGARHRKCGSKSKKCTLPSDMLTAKEIKERSGEVISMNPQKRYNLGEFHKFPDDIKGIYIKAIQKRFHVGPSDIAEMLGMKPEAFRNYALMHNIIVENFMPSDTELQAWNAWCSGEPIPVVPTQKQEEPLPKSYEELKAMSDDELKAYLDAITKRFQVSMTRISRFMCGKMPSVLPALLERRGIPFEKGIRGSDEDRKAFHDWLADKPVVETEVVKNEPVQTGTVHISKDISLDLTGDPRAVADKMIELADLLGVSSITIKITAIE